MARLVGSTGHVHAIEVSPSTYTKLLRNIQLNSATNVTAVNIGISDTRSQLSLVQDSDKNTGGNYLVCTAGSTRTMSLDEYVREQNLKSVDFIKADIEGFEMLLLRGAENTISRFHPAMLIEINPGAFGRCNSNAGEVIQWLVAHGYTTRRPTWYSLVPFSIKDVGAHANVIAST